MKPEDRKKLEDHIKQKIQSVKSDIVSYKKLTKPVSPDNAIGRLTRMEAINNKSINEAALRKAQDTLLRLERALKSIKDPDFGLCTACEEPIPHARLMIMPESTMCVACAEKY